MRIELTPYQQPYNVIGIIEMPMPPRVGEYLLYNDKLYEIMMVSYQNRARQNEIKHATIIVANRKIEKT